MKIISIISSCRKDGNTSRIVSLIEKQILSITRSKNIDIELEKVYLGEVELKNCRGCRLCFDKSEAMCPLKDELLVVRDKILQADGLLVASPVYVEDVNGVMKNWIDRMAFISHRPAFAGKTAIVITTSGIGSSNHAFKTINTALNTWGISSVAKGKFRTGALMKTDEMDEKYYEKIKKISSKLVNTVIHNETPNPSLYSLVSFRVQQKYWQKHKNIKGAFDFEYWKCKGWIKPDCEFYLDHKANFIKVNLARLTGNIVALFFI